MTTLPLYETSDRTGVAPRGFAHRAASVPGVKLHYVIGGKPLGEAPIMLLIHGFPQNWWSWSKVMPALGQDYTVVVPDLRGVGLSERPASGYTKRQLAADLFALVESLGQGPAHVVGHDIGAMVAYAYAWQFPARSMTVLDGALPGLGDWDRTVKDSRLWHFAFHQKLDLPEALVCGGREGIYISTFINDRLFNPGAISSADMDEYVRAYSHPGAFRAGMEMYRAIPADVADNRAAGALPAGLRTLALGGDRRWGLDLLAWLKPVSPTCQGAAIQDCGHFLAEEQPEKLIQALHAFCAG